MKILVFNSGIHSVEFELLEMPEEKLLLHGLVSKIGSDNSIVTSRDYNNKVERKVKKTQTHESALKHVVEILSEYNIEKKDIAAVGHRVVHGGVFSEPIIIDGTIKKEIYKDVDLAPMHNPYNLKIIEAAQLEFPDIKHVAVFDTAFHTTISEVVYRYPLPERLYHEHKIRRYGFHGIFHKYALEKTAERLGKDINSINMLSCYLGDGSSATAIKGGKSYDTSMGFTPLDGLMMKTRCGDISAGILIYLLKLGWSIKDIERMLMYESGLLGVSGESDDIDRIVEKAVTGDRKCQLAIDMYVYSVRKYIGAYWMQLPELDALSLTGDIAERSPYIRKKIFEGLEYFGLTISDEINSKVISADAQISAPDSKIKVFVFTRSAEVLLARETYRVICERSERSE